MQNAAVTTTVQSLVVTEAEAGAMLGGVPAPTMARWRSEGKGPRFIKVGRRIAYRTADLEAWLDEQTRQRTTGRVVKMRPKG